MNNAVSGIRILPAEIDSARARTTPDKSAFVETLQNAMDQVQDAQGAATNKIAELMNGNGMDVHSAMIAVEKADLSFQLMMQVRNKIVAAYQEVSRLQF